MTHQEYVQDTVEYYQKVIHLPPVDESLGETMEADRAIEGLLLDLLISAPGFDTTDPTPQSPQGTNQAKIA